MTRWRTRGKEEAILVSDATHLSWTRQQAALASSQESFVRLLHHVSGSQMRGVRWLSSEGVGLEIRRLPDLFPAVPNDVVSLGNVPVLTVSRSG